MTLKDTEQLLKCRDDHAPVLFSFDPSAQADVPPFVLNEGVVCPWVKPGEPFGTEKLRSRIEPWLTALVQSEHLSVLFGSGLTHALHDMAIREKLPGMSSSTLGIFDAEINAEAKRTAEAAGRSDGNIEDQIRVSNELLRGLEVIAATNAALQPYLADAAERDTVPAGNLSV